MPDEFVSYPKRPMTPTELIRVGAAMLPFGLPFGDGFTNKEIWIAMETELPHMLVGIVESREAAIGLLGVRAAGAPHAEVYGPFSPPKDAMRALDDTDPCEHDDTQLDRSAADLGDLRPLHRKHADVTRMTLTIEWALRDGLPTRTVINIKPHTDTIFLTRASREAFAYPRYVTLFGPQYVEALRYRLGELESH